MVPRERAIELAFLKGREELDRVNVAEPAGGRPPFRIEDYDWVCTDAGGKRTFHAFLFTYRWPSPYWYGRIHFAGHPGHFLVRVYDDDASVVLIRGE